MEQKRVSDTTNKDDADHADLIMKLSKGEAIGWEDIAQYKHLSKDDLINSPDEWKYAPVLVASNLERTNINAMKVKQWAKDNDTYVFRWLCKVGREVNKPPPEQMENIIETNDFFWQYFVQGAPSYLSQGINGDIALVNGAPISLHSLTFENALEHERVSKLISGPNALPCGSIINIERPLSVNVEVEEALDGKPVTARRRDQLNVLKSFSIVEDRIVLPLVQGKASFNGDDWHTFSYRTNDLITYKGTATVRDIFPYQLGFAMTIHKAQGRTIKRVVLDISRHPNHQNRVEYASLFVGLSRVTSKQHLRLIKHHDMSMEQSYKYIENLKPNENVTRFYGGFQNDTVDADGGMTWSWEKAIGTKKQ